ncbi:HAD family hydrolase [Streptomyces reniochalinae]|uniref:HAD family hydrolase n=1 Tax=Streptomyces reniochalinae TaxID=2250578 RepID=A0A367EKQ1_9ACTN|nr:HAD family hydrolase [Streptomyces reniochalinae]
MLCDVDDVIRYYDTEPLARLERDAGLAAGTTARLAFAPERGRPLLLGRISKPEWAVSVAEGLAGLGVPGERARALAAGLAQAPFRADAEVVGILRRARARMPLVLVTNGTAELDDDLASLGLDGLAHHVVNSARVGVAKPDAAIYRMAAEWTGVAPERCVFVDDRQENVAAAVALGMRGHLYREPSALEEALGLSSAP